MKEADKPVTEYRGTQSSKNTSTQRWIEHLSVSSKRLWNLFEVPTKKFHDDNTISDLMQNE